MLQEIESRHLCHSASGRGSARIAIDVTPQFDTLVFMESKPSHCAALHELARQHRDRDIRIVEGDADEAIQTAIGRGRWDRTRAVMFLDPCGMDVEWETLEAVAATKAIDVWYLFSLSGFYRQATHRMSDIDDNKREAITRQLGTDTWRRELYSDLGQGDFFGGEEKRRMADVKGLEKYAKVSRPPLSGEDGRCGLRSWHLRRWCRARRFSAEAEWQLPRPCGPVAS
jgi:three-Cys-motif partner protein